jgi:hypothetical protein
MTATEATTALWTASELFAASHDDNCSCGDYDGPCDCDNPIPDDLYLVNHEDGTEYLSNRYAAIRSDLISSYEDRVWPRPRRVPCSWPKAQGEVTTRRFDPTWVLWAHRNHVQITNTPGEPDLCGLWLEGQHIGWIMPITGDDQRSATPADAPRLGRLLQVLDGVPLGSNRAWAASMILTRSQDVVAALTEGGLE